MTMVPPFSHYEHREQKYQRKPCGYQERVCDLVIGSRAKAEQEQAGDEHNPSNSLTLGRGAELRFSFHEVD